MAEGCYRAAVALRVTTLCGHIPGLCRVNVLLGESESTPSRDGEEGRGPGQTGECGDS